MSPPEANDRSTKPKGLSRFLPWRKSGDSESPAGAPPKAESAPPPAARPSPPDSAGGDETPKRSRPRRRGGRGRSGRDRPEQDRPEQRQAERQPVQRPQREESAREAEPRPRRERPSPQPSPSKGEGAKWAQTGKLPRDRKFGDIGVSEPVAKALEDMGYTEPTPIQTNVVPVMLSGRHLVGQAQTGTGKTAAFAIPIAETVDGSRNEVQAIVLTPTRELAQQVTTEVAKVAKYRGIRAVSIYGGQPIKRQLDALEEGAHVVVGTPGHIQDHMERGTLHLDKIRIVVLDEADQMLDIGFFPDIRRIMRHTPRNSQRTLFSATVPTIIKRLIYSYFEDPEFITVGPESEPVEHVDQYYCEVADRDKFDGLLELFTDDYEQALIFRRTQIGVDKLVAGMKRRGHAIEAIHGAMPQAKRDAAMHGFREGRIKLLVATNLASRGIDVPAVSNVINYDMPENIEEYLHRIGRTARMGRGGVAVTFVGEWDFENFEPIKERLGDRLKKRDLNLYKPRATG